MDNTQDTGNYQVGDIIVGHADPSRSVYSSSGSKIFSGGIIEYGDTQSLQKKATDIANSIKRAGGSPVRANVMVTKKDKRKNNKPANTDSFSYSQNFQVPLNNLLEHSLPSVTEKQLTTVQFENDFGKIKSKVEDVIEHDMAFMLVFTDEDSIVFEPKIGENLTIYTERNRKFEVYYPGVTFDSPDSTKKFMILFKLPQENQE